MLRKKIKKKIALKLKELGKDKTSKIKEKSGLVSVNIAGADFGNLIQESKKVCKDLGFKAESDKIDNCILELMEISNGYEIAKTQERILVARAKKQEDIDMKFSYESESGVVANKESKWNKFWGAVGYIMHEHGEEIINLAVDAYFGTSSTASSSNTRCVAQRVGNSSVMHMNCRGGSRTYCSAVRVGNMTHVNCRQK
tara:strand:+ start:67 stop:660 length:594 start_codon:yes stop_codon:yes gene_type:complete